MIQLRSLKQLVQILFALSLFVLFFLIPFMLISIVMPESIPFKIDGEMAKDVSLLSKLVVFIAIGGVGCFIYALHIFKQNLVLFEKKRVFDPAVIANFKKMRRFIYLGGLLYIAGAIAFRLTRGELSIELGFIAQMLFIFALGLFFEILAGVFQTAKKLKEENDLTV